MVIFRLTPVSVAVSVAVSIAVAGFAFGSSSAFFEELLHSGDFFGIVFFVGSAIGLCLLGLGDVAMDGQPGILGVFENHHRGAEFLEVRTWGFVEVLFNNVHGPLEDAVEAVVVFEEFLAGCHDGVVLSRGDGGISRAGAMGKSGRNTRATRLADGIVGETGGWGHSLAGLCGNRGGRMML
jgi:hypothetical protein